MYVKGKIYSLLCQVVSLRVRRLLPMTPRLYLRSFVRQVIKLDRIVPGPHATLCPFFQLEMFFLDKSKKNEKYIV